MWSIKWCPLRGVTRLVSVLECTSTRGTAEDRDNGAWGELLLFGLKILTQSIGDALGTHAAAVGYAHMVIGKHLKIISSLAYDSIDRRARVNGVLNINRQRRVRGVRNASSTARQRGITALARASGADRIELLLRYKSTSSQRTTIYTKSRRTTKDLSGI